jgi:hypothetical protein
MSRPAIAILAAAVSGNMLFANMDGRGAVPLTAQSETSFSGLCGLGVEFLKTAPGQPAQLLVKHVSGDYRFERN